MSVSLCCGQQGMSSANELLQVNSNIGNFITKQVTQIQERCVVANDTLC